MRLWRGHRLLGTKVEVRKDWKAVAEEVVAHPPEKLMGEKPRWQKSNPGKRGSNKLASQRRLNRGKSSCGYPRGTTHKLDPQPYSPCSLTFKVQNSVTRVAATAVVDHGSHNVDIPIKGHSRWAKLRLRENRGRGGNRWSRVLSKGSCNHRRGRSEFPEAGVVMGGRESKGDRGGVGESTE